MTWIMEISLSERKNYEIWLAIADNRIADALQHLKTNVGEEKRTWLSIFKKPITRATACRRQAMFILTGGALPECPAPSDGLDMAINSFPEWIRLLYALQDNGRYEGLIRLEGIEMFETERAFLERVIEREPSKRSYINDQYMIVSAIIFH